MRILKKIQGRLQTHILTVFSLLLFLSFAMVGMAFNLAVHRYVTASAVEALTAAQEMTPPHRGWFMRTLDGNRRFHQAEVHTLTLSEVHLWRNLVWWNVNRPPNSDIIAAWLADTTTPYDWNDFSNRRVHIDNQVFFISASSFRIPPPSGGDREPVQFIEIFYLDVTYSLHFVTVVNRLLLALVTLIWLVSMVIAGFLADSMVRPLRLLRDFVRKIGSGDFSPNSLTFANEEFEELNQSLNQTARQLAGYDNDQKTFFQNVSHELRTPLMSIKSYAEGIKYGIMPADDASETILDATARLTGMVDDILYVSRIDNLTLPPMENANLRAIVNERVRQQRQLVVSKGLVLNYDPDGEPINILCVKSYIDRAVDNLISNAVRYASTTITVECFAMGVRAILCVTDDGEGFETEVLPLVFERFYRGKNGLAGIGLSIVKSIIDQHKGIATAENGPEGGAILTLSLPRQK
ncbi:MAG: HAMP domain-containing histidine kinase [Defluviitaleaceae bacterium]|nr:HAMP domain-containing histidine kinase [Defluviitaleaceae bacterium]